MTPEQRSDISNGIWMCPTHASLIDKEDCAYKTEDIKHWKTDAENKATRQLEQNHHTHPVNIESKYSKKDISILAEYSNVMSYNNIILIRNEFFGSIVKDAVTNPLYMILEMEENPRFKFQDYELENLRKTLNSQVKAFFHHFGQQSAGITGGYVYIDLNELDRTNPGNRSYWEGEIYKTQNLAAELCSTAMKLLEIKENN